MLNKICQEKHRNNKICLAEGREEKVLARHSEKTSKETSEGCAPQTKGGP